MRGTKQKSGHFVFISCIVLYAAEPLMFYSQAGPAGNQICGISPIPIGFLFYQGDVYLADFQRMVWNHAKHAVEDTINQIMLKHPARNALQIKSLGRERQLVKVVV